MASGRILSIIYFIITVAVIIPGDPITKTVINDPNFPRAQCTVNQDVEDNAFR